jgi:uncharacterized protein involved in exopolysaccharide biosynthesis
MKLADVIRILRKHLLLILVIPILLATIVLVLTRKPAFKYSSATTLYTGFTSTSTVEMNKSSNYYSVSTAFDNLISIIKSRETQQEVCIRLLAQHLMLAKNNPRYLTDKSYDELNGMVPPNIKALVVKSGNYLKSTDRYNLSFINSDSLALANPSLPASIDPVEYEQTVKNLKDYMLRNDTNFVYKLLNYEHPHYSIDAISSIDVKRLENSDLLEMKYETDDPGIAQQTLNIYTEVCIRIYKRITENRSDVVIKYFENQLDEAKANLKVAEEKLLAFNNSNNIINYGEQSKAVAMAKENLDVEFNNKKIKLAGVQAVIKRLEERLGSQQQNQLKSSDVIDKRNQLGDLNYQITSAETMGSSDPASAQKLAALKKQAEKLKNEIKVSVGELYSKGNSTDGIPAATILKEWIDNVVESENLKASMDVLSERMKEQQKEYSVYAPAGSNIKRIEREISVSEQRYLDILHSLNLAKLKMQDNEMASNIKTFDAPYFPLSPVPTKRKLMVMFAAVMGLMIVLAYIFLIEFLDNTLKNPSRASGIIKLPVIGVVPKIQAKQKKINLPLVTNRLMDIAVQYIELHLNEAKKAYTTKTLLFFSTQNAEGKTVFVINLARKLEEQGKKVLVLSYDHESLKRSKLANSEEYGQYEESANAEAGDKIGSVDHANSFLSLPGEEHRNFKVVRYTVNSSFYTVKNYQDILKINEIAISDIPDFVLIELPSIMYNPYPVSLLSNSDLSILICRSNRAWSLADKGALDRFTKFTDNRAYLVLNGVDIPAIDSVLGDSPSKIG